MSMQYSQVYIANVFRVSQATISNLLAHRTYKDVA